MSISVGPFKLDVSISGRGVKVSFSVDFHGIKASESLNLSANHLSASWSSPSIADFSAGLSVSIDDHTGYLTATAKFCHPKPGWHGWHPTMKEACDTKSVSIKVLPAHGLALLAAGITSKGLDWLEHQTLGPIPSPSEMDALRHAITPAMRDAVKKLDKEAKSILDGVETGVRTIAQNSTALDTLRRVGPEPIQEVLTKACSDPRMQALYPGLKSKFPVASEAIETTAADGKSGGQKAVEIIVEILVATVAFAGLATAVIGAHRHRLPGHHCRDCRRIGSRDRRSEA